MSTAPAAVTWDDLACAAQDAVPDGWLTATQWSDHFGMSAVHTRHRLRGAVLSGKWESQNFRIVTGQVLRPVPHYRPKS